MIINRKRISGSAGGGTPASVAPKDVNFYDYDGTWLFAYTLAEAQALAALPTQPTHAGLTGQGWNYTLAQVNALTQKCNVGALYITDDGKTRLKIRLTTVTGLSPILYFNKSDTSTMTIDWGDSNSQTDTRSGAFTVSHTYAANGDYTITCWISSGSGTYGFGDGDGERVLGSHNDCYVLLKCYIGENVTSIGDLAFFGCPSLTSIVIPSDVTSIDIYAFYACSSLTSIVIPSGVTSIGGLAFDNCSSLTSIVIPSGVTSIGDSAFYNCSSLTSIVIPSGVTSIGDLAFDNCLSLTSIVIPSGVTSIGTSAFYACYSLTSIVIPSGVTSIGESAFYNCLSLTSITIPSSVTTIGAGAFQYCTSLLEYTFIPTTPPTLSNINAFTNMNLICLMKIPAASLTAYKAATNWSTYANYMVGVVNG